MTITDQQTEILAILLWKERRAALGEMESVSWLRLTKIDRDHWRQIALGELPIPEMD